MERIHPLDLTAVIRRFHSFHARKLTGNGVVVEYLQKELDIREHDARSARDDQVDGLTVFLPRLDRTVLELASQAIGFSDEAAAVYTGEIGEIDLVRTAFASEYLAALFRTRGPCTGEVERARVPG